MENFNSKNLITLFRDDVFMDSTYNKFASHHLTQKGVDDDGHEYVTFYLTDLNNLKYNDSNIIIEKRNNNE